MMRNFWAELPKPFFCLAPLANVTDAAFRRLIAKYSKTESGAHPASPKAPSRGGYVTYTEFVSADGLALAPEAGRAKLMRDLAFTEVERPIVAQFFTAVPEHMEAAAALAARLGFDGVDINMGCPDRAVEKQGAGAALIQAPERARALIAAAKRGAPGLPVSVKTRLGYSKDALEEWLPALLEAEPAAVILHARTRKEMSNAPARWERVKRAVELRDALGSRTLIAGNGDARDLADARRLAAASGADGAMLGRAVFGTPWLFAPRPVGVEERLRIAVEHTKLFEELLGDIKSFALMKKHYKAYVEGFPGAKELRVNLMGASTAAEVEAIVNDFLSC